MTDADQIASRYIETWNEKDPTRRERLLAENWTDDASYVDPVMQGAGKGEISELIAGAHMRFPGFLFALDGQADSYADKIRFSWTFGPPSEPDMIKGTDFALVEAGRLRQVTGFLDKVPAAA